MSRYNYDIPIVDEASLLRACDCLHDASFDLSNLVVDTEKGIWQGLFKQDELDGSKFVKKPYGIIFEKWTFPLRLITLSLRGVTDYSIFDGSRIGIYSFNECRIENTRCIFKFVESMFMTIGFNGKPVGELKDLGLTEEIGHIHTLRNPFSNNKGAS